MVLLALALLAFLLVGVISHPAHFERRAAIRATWLRYAARARGGPVVVRFLVGHAPEDALAVPREGHRLARAGSRVVRERQREPQARAEPDQRPVAGAVRGAQAAAAEAGRCLRPRGARDKMAKIKVKSVLVVNVDKD